MSRNGIKYWEVTDVEHISCVKGRLRCNVDSLLGESH